MKSLNIKKIAKPLSKVDQSFVEKVEELNNHEFNVVLKIAKLCSQQGISLEETYNIGLVGLTEAKMKLADTKFDKYFEWWVRQSVLKYLKVNH